jgi:hypothetical protein
MKGENVILDKSCFCFENIKAFPVFKKEKVDTGLCSQILDSGTAIARSNFYLLIINF